MSPRGASSAAKRLILRSACLNRTPIPRVRPRRYRTATDELNVLDCGEPAQWFAKPRLQRERPRAIARGPAGRQPCRPRSCGLGDRVLVESSSSALWTGLMAIIGCLLRIGVRFGGATMSFGWEPTLAFCHFRP